MKFFCGTFLLFSAVFSAQTSLAETVKPDSIHLSKIESPLIQTSAKVDSIDSAIAKLYKMPVAKPKKYEIHSSLKSPVKGNTQFKILNPLDSLKTKKLATK